MTRIIRRADERPVRGMAWASTAVSPPRDTVTDPVAHIPLSVLDQRSGGEDCSVVATGVTSVGPGLVMTMCLVIREDEKMRMGNLQTGRAG